MFVACQNKACPDYQKAKAVPDGLTPADIGALVCGVCGLAEYIQVQGPAAPEPPPTPPEFYGVDLAAAPPAGTPLWVEVTHNGQNYALPLTPIPAS